MNRVEELLQEIRAELADPNNERWSQSRLLSLLSIAQTEIAHETRVLVSKTPLPIIAGKREYDLPADVDIILRVYGPEGPVETVSHFEMDTRNPLWETVTGPRLEAVVYDLLTPSKLIVYPIVNEDSQSELYPFTSGGASVGYDRLGVVTGIGNYTFSAPIGTVVSLSEPGVTEAFNSYFGIVTDIAELMYTVTVQYSRIPAAITATNSPIELPLTFKAALFHLTCAKAFRGDLDTRSVQKSNEHTALYLAQLRRLQLNKATNSVKGANTRTIAREVF